MKRFRGSCAKYDRRAWLVAGGKAPQDCQERPEPLGRSGDNPPDHPVQNSFRGCK